MAATCLDRYRDDDTSIHLCIACPDEHILSALKSHENVELEMVPEESLNGKEPEETQFKKRLRASKSSLKERISASQDMMSHLGKRIKECFVTNVSKLQLVCGRKRGMLLHLFESVNRLAVD